MIRIETDNSSAVLRPVAQCNRDGIGAVDDMKICDDVSLGVPDKAGPRPLRNLKQVQ